MYRSRTHLTNGRWRNWAATSRSSPDDRNPTSTLCISVFHNTCDSSRWQLYGRRVEQFQRYWTSPSLENLLTNSQQSPSCTWSVSPSTAGGKARRSYAHTSSRLQRTSVSAESSSNRGLACCCTCDAHLSTPPTLFTHSSSRASGT